MALGWRGGENVSANGWANGVMDQPRQGMRHRTPPRRLRVLPPSEPRHTPDPCGIRRAVTHRDFTSDEVKAAEKAIDKLLQEGASTALSTGTCTAAPDFLSGAAVRNQPGSGRYTYQPGCGSVTSRELTQQSTAKSTGRAGYPRKVGIREKQQRVQKEKLQGCSARGFKFASARWRSQFTLRGARPVEDGDTNGRLPKIPTVAHGSEQARQARARQLRNAKPSRAVDSIQQRTTLLPSIDPKKLAQAREEMNAVGARQRKIKLRWKWKGGKMLKEIDCFYAARLNMARLDPAEIRGLVRARATLAKENTELLDQSRCAQIEIVHKDMLKELFAELDSDGSGELEEEEISELAKRLGSKLTRRQVLQAMEEMDGDGGGGVDFGEFYAWFTSDVESVITKDFSVMEKAIIEIKPWDETADVTKFLVDFKTPFVC